MNAVRRSYQFTNHSSKGRRFWAIRSARWKLLLMSLAYSCLHKSDPDPARAEKYARSALELVPRIRIFPGPVGANRREHELSRRPRRRPRCGRP
jgi:hypothetical protein